MRTRAFWVLALAIVFAVAAVVLAQDWISKKSAVAAGQGMPTTTVVVANTALDFGAVLRREHIRAIRWPAGSVPKGAFRSFDKLLAGDTNRVVLRRIEANEPILETKVSGFGGRASLSRIIADDMRAATIRVNDVNGVAGFVLPGDRVDLLLTRDRSIAHGNRRRNDLVTDVLLQNIKVLAIDQDADKAKDKPSVAKAVTLEVTSHQSQKLVLAQKVGTLSLALRNVKNAAAAPAPTVRVSDLRFGEANEPAVRPKPRKSKTSGRRKHHTSRRNMSSIKIVRGLTASGYRVPAEQKRPVEAAERADSPKPAPARKRIPGASRKLPNEDFLPGTQWKSVAPPKTSKRTIRRPVVHGNAAPVRLYPMNRSDQSLDRGGTGPAN